MNLSDMDIFLQKLDELNRIIKNPFFDERTREKYKRNFYSIPIQCNVIGIKRAIRMAYELQECMEKDTDVEDIYFYVEAIK